jgi:anti-sigma factor RsiW
LENDFENAKKLVEATIRKIGLDPANCRASSASATQSAWTLKRGSASILVAVTKREDEGGASYLRVASPVVTLPADRAKHEAVFRKLLELNAAGLANAAFGLIGDRVVVVSERPSAGLDEGEVEQTVRHLAAVADTFDDRLEKDFGATRA